MKTIRIGIAAVALGTALAACGTQVAGIPNAAPGATGPGISASSSPGPATAPTSGAGDEAAVEAVFHAYYQALLTRDWATACQYAAPATITTLLQNLKSHAGVTVDTCEQAFATIYADPATATGADGITRSAQIQKTTVSGDSATITWSASYQGQARTVSSQMTRIAGKWLLLDTGT